MGAMIITDMNASGHYDYKYLRFQAIDTPGILDHPLDEMNVIEQQSITALAHLKNSAVLYFMDLSEQCGYSVDAQISLFNSIKPLFQEKLVFVVINKIDVRRPEDLDPETQAQLQNMLKPGEVEMLQVSCTTTEGVTEVKNTASERLIAERVAAKFKAGTKSSGEISGRLGELLGRIHVAQPLNGVVRETFIPDAVKAKARFDKDDPMRPRLAREIEEAEGGAGVYNINLKDKWLLADEDWKNDKIPELINGMNVSDFIDPEIEAKLAALEAEEERLEAEGYYESDDSAENSEDAEMHFKAELIREKMVLMKNDARAKKSINNKAQIPRQKRRTTLATMEDNLDQLGYDTRPIVARAHERNLNRGRALERSAVRTKAAAIAAADAMDVDMPGTTTVSREPRSQSNRREGGIVSVSSKQKAERLAKIGMRKMNRMARQGEADRHIAVAKPKHLVSLAGFADGVGLTASSTRANAPWVRHPIVESWNWCLLLLHICGDPSFELLICGYDCLHPLLLQGIGEQAAFAPCCANAVSSTGHDLYGSSDTAQTNSDEHLTRSVSIAMSLTRSRLSAACKWKRW